MMDNFFCNDNLKATLFLEDMRHKSFVIEILFIYLFIFQSTFSFRGVARSFSENCLHKFRDKISSILLTSVITASLCLQSTDPSVPYHSMRYSAVRG